jgi:hypothetical protein
MDLQGDSKLLSGVPWPINFKTENNKIKLVNEYKNVTKKIVLAMLQHFELHFHIP